ncbi:hypothetical protein DBR43_02330 [Pedobacter sp. KBW06]|uniref:RelA/SpoT domain-containing protein n=1 Tax=Pedobacter sp. KBW06 TaxID=2153359 RepID=UPI000F596EC2|nr:hypothetical protein [Pedobacter sp. KBW06]RQO74256.1 hypothetical protein DBR43_02330 [Pedobacter sp. KBW06]
MEKLMPQVSFFKKYNIELEKFESTNISWADLEEIYRDYIIEIPFLEDSAIYFFNNIMKIADVHSVRYRVKDPEHVIEKIIRKRISTPDHIINIGNYKSELTDLIGVRALHLFKEQWRSIHEAIITQWDLKQNPEANYREGDPKEFKDEYEAFGCETKPHQFGYRSVHYIAKSKPGKTEYFAEIQVRTIFEEAWSEIDHTIRYPYDQNNIVYGQFLSILNRLAGSADEMGTYISFLKRYQTAKEISHIKDIEEKDAIIVELNAYVKKLNLKEKEAASITSSLDKLNRLSSLTDNSLLTTFGKALSTVSSDVFTSKFQNITGVENLIKGFEIASNYDRAASFDFRKSLILGGLDKEIANKVTTPLEIVAESKSKKK